MKALFVLVHICIEAPNVPVYHVICTHSKPELLF